MAKKLKDEIETVEAVEAKTEELVAVEMSPEQRDEFVDFMKDKKAQEEKKAEIDAEKEQFVHVRLSVSHYINGKKYGPGVVKVSMDLLGILQHQENNWKKHELNIFAPSRTHLMKVLEGGQVVGVALNSAPKGVKEAFT